MDNEKLVINSFKIKLYKLPSGVFEMNEKRKIIWSCNYLKSTLFENHTFLSGTHEGLIKIWSCFSEKPLVTFQAHRLTIKCLICLSDSQIASGSQDKTIKIWTLNEKEFVCSKTLNGHDGSIKCLLRRDERIIFSGSCDSTIKMWHVNTCICLKTFQGHEQRVDCLQLDKDKCKLFSGSKDKTIKIWLISRGECLQTLIDPTSCVSCLEYDTRRAYLISGSADGTIKIWNTKLDVMLNSHTNRVCALVLLATGDLVSASQDKTIRIWSLMKRTNLFCIKILNGHQMCVWCLEVLPLGQLVSGSNDGTVRCWSLKSGKCERILTDKRNRNTCLALRKCF